MGKVIAICNNKGGVTKTTTTRNLAKGLANEGKTVLLIDIDPQFNLTKSINVKPTHTLLSTFLEGSPLPVITFENGLGADKQGAIDLVAGDGALDGPTSLAVAQKENCYFILSAAIALVRDNYDFVLIDCPPSIGIYTANAIIAADGILIASEPGSDSLEGIQNIKKQLLEIGEVLQKELKIIGVLFGRYKSNVSLHRSIKITYDALFPGEAFQTVIHECAAVGEARQEKKDIFTYRPKSSAAKDFEAFCSEFLNRIS